MSLGRVRDGDEPPMVQLVTPVPKALRRAVKLHCLTSGQTMTRFITAAIAEALARKVRTEDRS